VTLIELCVDRAGFRRGAKVMAFVMAWGSARDALGHSPAVEEYADFWKQPYRSAWREVATFKEAFPELDRPDALLDAMAQTDPAGAIDTGALSLA
jgi:hypothetical protein